MLVFFADTPQQHHKNIIDFLNNEKERAEREATLGKTKVEQAAKRARVHTINTLIAYIGDANVVPNPKADIPIVMETNEAGGVVSVDDGTTAELRSK